MIKGLLLPREKFAEINESYGDGFPTLEIEKGNQVLFYFGSNHSHDPNNHQYPILRKYWEKFLKASSDKEKIVFVEGGVGSPTANEETAIRESGENGFMIFNARAKGISVVSPDLTLESLAEQFSEISKDEIILYRFLDMADSFRRGNTAGLSFEEYVEKWCIDKRRRKKWAGIDISLPAFKKAYLKVQGREFDVTENINSLIDPNNTGTRMNEISRILTDAREVNIVSEIEKYWKEEKNIFAVFGSGHLIIQRPALEKILK